MTRKEMVFSKRCGRCRQTKSSKAFNLDAAYSDGLGFYCRECAREKRAGRYVLYNREWSARHPGYAMNSVRWISKNPEKRQAHLIIKRAIKSGRLKRLPCEKCNNGKSEAHHDDYSKPLDVRWLCRKHHAEHHRLIKLHDR